MQVVNDARCRVFEVARSKRVRIEVIMESINLSLGEISLKAVKRVSQCLFWLTHHRRAYHHTERVENHLCSIAVGVHQQEGLEHTVIVAALCLLNVAIWQALA